MTTHKLTVSESQSGQTLLSFLRGNLATYPSVKAIKRAIDQKKCMVNGAVEFFSTYKVKRGEKIEISFDIPVVRYPLKVLYEDEGLIIYNKPPGMASESFEGLYLVHRLDKETSGAMILAKTEEMLKAMQALFAKRKVAKQYLAICDGAIKKDKWRVENYLGKKVSYQGGVLMGKHPKGKLAITEFEKVADLKGATLIRAYPLTGRTHQIRVHLRDEGHPVLGDWQYARKFSCPDHPPRHMLHAEKISFVHPVSGETITVKAPQFPDFLEALRTKTSS